MLVCPEDRTPLELADRDLLAAVNRAIASRQLRNKGGEAVAEPLDAGLVRKDRTLLYPIIDRIPILLLDAGIPLAQLGK
jgi:uncharacterized protein YbaR (Trm112 family)